MKKLKLILSIIIILMCMATVCFAEDEPVTISLDEQPLTTLENETTASPISEGENTNSEESNEANSDSINPEEKIEIHKGDFFKTGIAFEVSEAIDGNAFIYGTDVIISGQINGDLYIAASSSITLAEGSVVYGNVFATAPNITQTGIVYSLYAICDNYKCDYDGMAQFDVKVLANNIDFQGYVERHVYLAASESLSLSKDAFILGNFNYYANNVTIDEEATVKGQTIANEFEASSRLFNKTSAALNYATSFITTLIILLIAFLAIILVKPSAMSTAASHLTKSPLQTLCYGAIVFILIPIVFTILLLSQIQIFVTIAFILLAITLLTLIVSTIMITIGLAKYLDDKFSNTKNSNSILAYVLIVSVALWLLFQIPYVRVIVLLMVWIFGLGTMIVSIQSNRKKDVTDTVVENKTQQTTTTTTTESDKKDVDKAEADKVDNKDNNNKDDNKDENKNDNNDSEKKDN